MRNILILLCATSILASDETPRVIIIGAGASGIAAAAKLFRNGIDNVTILEAEDRIGGRVYSVEMEEYDVDLGAQWVHGEGKNVVYEMAWPFHLLSHCLGPNDGSIFFKTAFKALARTVGSEKEAAILMRRNSIKFFLSTGEKMNDKTGRSLITFAMNLTAEWPGVENLRTGSVGEYFDRKINDYFNKHEDIPEDLKIPLVKMVHRAHMAENGAEDLYQASAKADGDYFSDGDQQLNWKTGTYGIILDLLMRKYPDPEEELPIVNSTLFNKKVSRIEYKGDGPVKVKTSDGDVYMADCVIFTPSLGVLKANHKNLFVPHLPPSKINAIEHIGMGHVGKIYLYYDEPWWTKDLSNFYRFLIWTEDDEKELASDPERRWMLSVYTVNRIEWKPKLICLWLTGPNIREMELLPKELVRDQSLWLLDKFFGKFYNLTEPTEMLRTHWNSNDNFLGTYSWMSLDAEAHNATVSDLAEPIMQRDGRTPAIMFAGEATSDFYSTVHGAIGSGWREAERIIDIKKRSSHWTQG
uniref:Smox_2 protein n=1 Tax=Fopius arisanus TaxID=64838 RepID=A0A0C9PGX1_9HYME